MQVAPGPTVGRGLKLAYSLRSFDLVGRGLKHKQVAPGPTVGRGLKHRARIETTIAPGPTVGRGLKQEYSPLWSFFETI
jgi:hypothetical protein